MYTNPYHGLVNGKWCKTNFHTHAGTGAGTCGASPTDKVVEAYRNLKFDILCISNHDIFTDTSHFTDERILMVPGVEYSQNEHMLTIGVNKSLHEMDHQSAITNTSDAGGFTILCHPNWPKKETWSWETLYNLKGYVGIEVINMLIYKLSGSGRATDTWDHILSRGKLIYGFGNDDFHCFSDAARSFNLIYCTECSYSNMKQAIERGAFCASTGLYPDYIKLEDNVIKVAARFPMETHVNTFTYRFIGENGVVLSVQEGTCADYKLSMEKYVRVEVIGENGAMLFFQPIYLTEAF